MSYFRAENISLHFGGLKAVDSVSFAVEKGEILFGHFDVHLNGSFHDLLNQAF